MYVTEQIKQNKNINYCQDYWKERKNSLKVYNLIHLKNKTNKI